LRVILADAGVGKRNTDRQDAGGAGAWRTGDGWGKAAVPTRPAWGKGRFGGRQASSSFVKPFNLKKIRIQAAGYTSKSGRKI